MHKVVTKMILHIAGYYNTMCVCVRVCVCACVRVRVYVRACEVIQWTPLQFSQKRIPSHMLPQHIFPISSQCCGHLQDFGLVSSSQTYDTSLALSSQFQNSNKYDRK